MAKPFGVARYVPPTRKGIDALEYEVVRIWERPVEEVLRSNVAMLPFAPPTDVPRRSLPSMIRRMEERIGAEAPKPVAAELWNATYTLMGLKYGADQPARY